jgi:hypothetical protein
MSLQSNSADTTPSTASAVSTPARDALAAQRDQGMSAIDAAAGVSIDCEYQVDGKTIRAWLFATPGRGAISIMTPTIVSEGGPEFEQLHAFLKDVPGPGEVKPTPGGEVAVARLHVKRDGDATLLVTADDNLSSTTRRY